MIPLAVLVLALASLEITEAQKMDFFTAYDMNKDGKVHPLEVKMSWMAWSNGMLYWSKDANLLAFDRDGDGQLDEAEFRAYEKDGTSLYYFALVDTNKDEEVTKQEVREFLQRSGWTEAAIESFAVNDFEGEDRDFEEFNKWFQSKVMDKDFAMEDFKAKSLSMTLDW